MNLIRLRTAALILACSMIAGCSSKRAFQEAWREAAAVSEPPRELLGRWEGEWRSEANGHHGPLRAIITRESDSRYSAWFYAEYKRLITLGFDYQVPLSVEARENEFKFEGEADLGWLAGGGYHYDGKATHESFESTYESKRDHGLFKMSRPNSD